MRILILIILLTSYSNQKSQTDNTPDITANGKKVHKCGLAVSRDLEDQGFMIGCRVHISGILVSNIRLDGSDYCNGLYVINDRMHWRKRNQVDIFNFDNDQALKFGVQKGKIQLLWCE